MEVIINEVQRSKYPGPDCYFSPADVLAFDIETTGFAAETTMLYMIGCAYYEAENWHIRQWFNEDGISEETILREFSSFASRYKFIITYNGDGFDIPYIKKKFELYHIPAPVFEPESVDIYKQIRFLRDILHLENLKQKSVEFFLGIHRLDKYTGGDLIRIYQDYIKEPIQANKQLLLQHNYEDLQGLLDCCSMLAYCRLKTGCFVVQKMSVRQNRLLFSLKLDYPLPRRMTITIHDIIVTGYENDATINTPIYSEEMKFYFDNYHEYYYLPAEDTAVHKSVASYVDKNYRQPAKKENCYLRKQGYFISQIDSGIMSGYKRSIKDTESFIELADSFLQNPDLLKTYARHIIRLALT